MIPHYMLWTSLFWGGMDLHAAIASDEGDVADQSRTVVVYTALDRVFSEPILDQFERDTGIEVLAHYDTESTKTVGLVNRLRAERHRPRCDVFWNNEIVNTIRLKQEGQLLPTHPENAQYYPVSFKDAEGYWYGLAARARVLLVNTEHVAEGDQPDSIFDLTEPRWKGKVGIAKPLFGTTASHVACLFADQGEDAAAQWLSDLKANDVQIMSGNKSCAQAVSSGLLHCGLTDTDDAIIEVESGKPVRIVYLDARPDQIGTLFIPNAVSLIKDCPHPDAGRKLIEYLLTLEVEKKLAACASAQIPLHMQFEGELRVKTPGQIKSMNVDFEEAARYFEKAAKYVEKDFLH